MRLIVYLLKIYYLNRLVVPFFRIFIKMSIMEIHETLKKVTEQSLTLQDCKFFLSKIGDEESQILYKNYYKKYHPKNSSLSHYFNRKLMEHLEHSQIVIIKKDKIKRVNKEN